MGITVAAVSRGFLQVDQVERHIRQYPTVEIEKWRGRKEKRVV